MDDATLRHRLDAVERRQTLLLWLLGGLYVLGGAWFLVEEANVLSPWGAIAGVVAVGLVAGAAGMYRRRRTAG